VARGVHRLLDDGARQRLRRSAEVAGTDADQRVDGEGVARGGFAEAIRDLRHGRSPCLDQYPVRPEPVEGPG